MQMFYMLVLFGTWLPIVPLKESKGTLTLIVKNLEAERGTLYVAVYESELHFLKENIIGKIIPVTSKPICIIPIPELPFGKYAVAVFHDLNGNGILDKNSFGVPTEPYAFSNNPAVKWRSPSFEETLVEFGEPQKDIILELKRWRKH
ncbi:MAG: DUF2141 domain-containing protein [Saprospiraceae bacterium]|nr:DUF2141 domain-containing protein [Saprospiraceae bacterium]